VYGHGGGLIGGFLATAKTDGYARYVGNGENRISTVHIDDLAKLYFLAAEKAQPGSILHASNDKPIKLREVAELVADAVGVPGKVQSWPVEEARKVVGAVIDGFVLDQQVVSYNTKKNLGWEAKAPYVTEEIGQYQKAVAGRKQ
jgi:nucleoside-diphosphate-sugar epimerase